jgi:hypothetical protein
MGGLAALRFDVAGIIASASALREASTRRAPRRAAMRAVARPMPLDAPVITMVCWWRGFSRMQFDAGQGGGVGGEGVSRASLVPVPRSLFPVPCSRFKDAAPP